MSDDTLDMVMFLAIVPVCLGLIIGFIGTAMALAHGDYGAAIICFILGVLSVAAFVLYNKVRFH